MIPAGDYDYTPEFVWHDVNGTATKYGFLPDIELIYPAVRDAKAAVRWLKAHAAELGAAPDFVVAYGSSAGACSAIGLGSDMGDAPEDYRDELAAVDPTLEYLDVPSTVTAVVSHWGGNHAIEVLEQHDNISRVTEKFAPLVAYHGTEDYAVGPMNEAALCERLAPLGVPCRATMLRGFGHDPTFSCQCCNPTCTDDGVVNCTGVPIPEPGGCEVAVDAATNATMDDDTLEFFQEYLGLALV